MGNQYTYQNLRTMAQKTAKFSDKKFTKKQFILLLAGVLASLSFGGVFDLVRKDKVEAAGGYGSRGYGQ